MTGATFDPVPFAYEDPYLRSAENVIYQADTSHMHRYPYIRDGEDLGRPDMFDEPFPSGSANYMDEFGKVDWGKLKGKIDLGKLKGKISSKLKKGDGKLLSRLAKGRAERKKKREERKASKGETPRRGASFISNVSTAVSKASLEIGSNIPEPSMTSNMFSQVAENEKVSIASRLQSAPQIPLMINQMIPVLQSEDELTLRAGDIQNSQDALNKSESKNRVLLYTTVAIGSVLGIFGLTLALKK